jgi:hypothetical protein
MLYIYLRLLGIPVALLAWILFQLLYKKRSWLEVKPDVQVTTFILAVWAVVYLVFLRS